MSLSRILKVHLLPREQWVDDCFDTSVDESLEDIKGDAQDASTKLC